MKTTIIITILLILIIASFFGFLYSGLYNVSTLKPHTPIVEWILTTTMDQSVKHHAKGIDAASLEKSEVKKGFIHYQEMCVTCHGAPGVTPSEMVEGLLPKPPILTEEGLDWKPVELFWITKNGIKMTSMPGWGSTHSDEKIWDIVSFLQRLPSLSLEDYRFMRQALESEEEDEKENEIRHKHLESF